MLVNPLYIAPFGSVIIAPPFFYRNTKSKLKRAKTSSACFLIRIPISYPKGSFSSGKGGSLKSDWMGDDARKQGLYFLNLECHYSFLSVSSDGWEPDNTSGLIRQYTPKRTGFSKLTDEMLAEIEWKLNHRPRKSSDYRTRWNIVNNYLTLTSEVYCTSKLNSPNERILSFEKKVVFPKKWNA